MTFQILKNFAISFPDVGHEGSYVEMVERFTSRNKEFRWFGNKSRNLFPDLFFSAPSFSWISMDSGCRILHIPNRGISITDVRPFLSEFPVWWYSKFPMVDSENQSIPKFQEPTVFDSNPEPSNPVICKTGFDLNRVYAFYGVFR